jgi:hypothetical protein
MAHHFIALTVILLLASVTFAFAYRPVCPTVIPQEDFKRRRNLWFALTLTAFISFNFWVFIAVSALLLLVAGRKEHNPLALFFFVLFAVPGISQKISGLGLIDHFFTIDYVRLLSITILFPAYLRLRKEASVTGIGRDPADWLILAYLSVNASLMFLGGSFTNALRFGVFYQFIDYFLPYYIASRSLRNLQDFRDALIAYVLAALVLSPIAAFETVFRWLVYGSIDNFLGIDWKYGKYLSRGDGGALRALGPLGQPIPLGYAIMVAIGFLVFLKQSINRRLFWLLGLAVLVVGIIAPLSRGPWIGAFAMVGVLVVAGPFPMKRVMQFSIVTAVIVAVGLASPFADAIISHLPFVGDVDEGNVTYRTRLIEISIGLVAESPWFGGVDFYNAQEMQELKWGNGLIDVVNTYIGVGLVSGYVGLGLFCAFFLSVVFRTFMHAILLADRGSELFLLGVCLTATLTGILVTIFTVSSISIISTVYWAVAGICVAYIRLPSEAKLSSQLANSATVSVKGRAQPQTDSLGHSATRGQLS